MYSDGGTYKFESNQYESHYEIFYPDTWSNPWSSYSILSYDEWKYILSQRVVMNSDREMNEKFYDERDSRYMDLSFIADIAFKKVDRIGYATVNGIKGLIILPDDWTLPAGCNFKATFINYTDNTYNPITFKIMEEAGAVFLPLVTRTDGSNKLPYGSSTMIEWHEINQKVGSFAIDVDIRGAILSAISSSSLRSFLNENNPIYMPKGVECFNGSVLRLVKYI